MKQERVRKRRQHGPRGIYRAPRPIQALIIGIGTILEWIIPQRFWETAEEWEERHYG